jgi:hypothetical protein
VIVSQVRSDEWKAPALQEKQDHAACGHSEREAKKQSAIVHHRDTKDDEMAKDRA